MPGGRWTTRLALVLTPVLVLAVTSCSTATGTTGADGPGPTVVPGTAGADVDGAPGTSAAPCGLPAAGTRTIDVGGTARSYDVYPPGGAAGPVPTLVLFHGFNSTKEEMARMTGLADQAPAAGVVLVVPQGAGTPTGWNVLTGLQADTAFVDAMLAEVQASTCVDPDDLWLAGFSAGSAFAAVYGCTHATAVAGLGLVSALAPAVCPPEGTPDVVITHGTADPVVPFAGGDQAVGDAKVALAPVPDAAAAWAAKAGCGVGPTVATVGSDVTVTRWTGCAGGTTVTFQAIDGGGHAWPGAVEPTAIGRTSQTISESCVLLAAITDPDLDPYPDCPGDGPPPA